MTHRIRIWASLLTMLALVAACSSPAAAPLDDAGGAPASDAPDTAATAEDGDGDDATPATERAEGCPPPPEGIAWTDEVSATIETLQEPSGDTAGIQAVVFPRPEYAGRPWSHWGQGLLLDDGRFYAAIGDHQGMDGNSFIYEFDPSTGALTEIADAQTIAGHIPGEYGYGKIHAAMVPGPCGEIYTSTYWGTRRDLAYNENYTGDYLIRIDPEQHTVASMGVLVPGHGAASMASWPEGGLIYAEPADPFGQKTGAFVAWDALTGEKVFETFDEAHDGYRTIAVDESGRAYISWGGNGIARFDPATNELETLDVDLPGGSLRASTGPDPDGTIYGVSREGNEFFALHTDGTLRQLGTGGGYTSVMTMDPAGGRFFYIPGAHGDAWEQNTRLTAVDTETGDETVLAELNPVIEEQLGLRTGGTYSLSVDASGKTFYTVLNAGDPASRDTFGEVILVIVTLP